MKAMIDDLDGLLGCPSGLNNAVSHLGPILGRDTYVVIADNYEIVYDCLLEFCDKKIFKNSRLKIYKYLFIFLDYVLIDA